MNAKIFSKDNCPYCVKAKALLEKRGIVYDEVSAVDNREALIETVTAMTGQPPKTVPQIFLGATYIGGYDDLVKHFARVDAEADAAE